LDFFAVSEVVFCRLGKKIESGVSWKKHRKLERASVRFAQKNQNQEEGRFLFFSRKRKSDFSDPASERFPPRGAVSRFAKRRNRRGKRVECRKPRNGSFRTDTRFLGGCVGPMRRATLPSVARPGRVRAVRARAGLERIPGVPSTSIVANVSRSSCVAVSERRACAVFDRSVRRDPEASFRRALAIFCALKCAMNARGGACERGGAITVGREATIAADWTRRSRDPAGACARQREWRGEGPRGAHQVFLAGRFLASPPGFANRENGRSCVRQNFGRGGENLEKCSASTEGGEVRSFRLRLVRHSIILGLCVKRNAAHDSRRSPLVSSHSPMPK
jgi:hypothetical protein